jgi:hypothetical protein
MRTRRNFDFTSIPGEFGSQPVPEGSVRVNHYTSPDAIDSIRQHGLTMQHAHESYARGGTEYPSIFATAGAPKEDLLRARPVVEAHIPVSSLDIGSHTSASDLESRHSVVTTNQDVPPENIMAVHQPWHRTFRYVQNDPGMEKNIMAGHYNDTGDEGTDEAIDATKVVLAGKVMLGGALSGKQWTA